MPFPTSLGVAASAEGAEALWRRSIGSIESADATASVTAIAVSTREGEQVRGVLIELRNSTTNQQVFITDTLLASFQYELRVLERTRRLGPRCESGLCVQGIARCRPSQPVPQAYCPGLYRTKDAVDGFILSAPDASFLFPAVKLDAIEALIVESGRAF
ncbi:MAG: hypothetical protein AAF515_15865 [Pseudomonadota bacterium]